MECSTEDVINYFVSLPRRRVSKLKEEYEPQQFLLENYKTNRNSVADAIAERTVNKCIQIAGKVGELQVENNKQMEQWKQNLNKLISLEQEKLLNRVKDL